MSNWQNVHSQWQRTRYYLIFLAAIWLSLGVPGCSFSPPNPLTASSPGLTQTTSQTTTSPAQRFDGVKINVVTNPGGLHLKAGTHIAEFEALTGAKIKLKEVPFINFRKLLEKNWSGNASEYDIAIILPQWQIDFADAGYIEDLTDRRKSDPALEWDDIAPLFRDFSANYKGRTYAIPLDGDFHLVYYRRDLLKQAGLKPPETWDDYLAVAKQFHGKDLNGDGKPDYGSCIAKVAKEISTTFSISFFASFLQSQGTAQGMFFDPETMKPLVNNSGFARALELYKQTVEYGVPDDKNLNLATARKTFLSGRCAMTLDWGDIGPLAIDQAVSRVIDKVGASITPGTTQVLDRRTNKLVACDKFTCPYAIEGVNHATYAANGGWVGVVAAKSPPKVKDAAYAFLSYMSQPAQSNIDVTLGKTGMNPYRISQFKNSDPWIKSGMSFEAANNYLGAIGVSLNSSNMVLDLIIPQNQQYIETLDAIRADFLVDKITKEEAMQQIEQRWEQITNQVGRESQRAAYRASLGLTQ
ncbi:MAG: extracellular solute-binding protein [Nostoc sp.]|uniref:extracellular solute-binding protein n=1 Tax=Nostoc sp. TaxID=1180 RepID=UPI002FF5142E